MGEKKFKTTKADELLALTRIRSILAELDPAGDVNIAFEGCCEIAESNIDDDLDCSYKKMCDVMSKRNEHLQEKLREMRIAQGDLETRFNTVEKFYKHRGELLEACFEQINHLKNENEHLKSENKKLCIENEVLQAQIHAANNTLKAYRTLKNIDEERIEKLKKVNAYLLDMLNKKLEQI